ncbi:MAG: hypothetical protein IJC83_04135, partial [Oscillospiraceae bacterium]|nr:hypothetical protein [Oscillospiraceae bacterium]
HSAFPDVYNAEPPQSAMAITDTNGKLLAVAGGRGIKEYDRGFNLATMAKRQPGSSIKPLAVYGPAIEYDLITWSTLIDDSAVKTNEKGNPWPVNYYGKYLGKITVDEAIQRSTNTVAVRLINQLSPKTSFDFLYNKLDMTSLVKSRTVNGKVYSDVDVATMSLGALTDGVTVLEMAGAYQIYANGGTFTKPYSYTRVEDANGNIILEHKDTYNRVISEETATIVNKLMQRVVTGPNGTGKTAKFSEMPVAGKTGTSSDDLDQWFAGVTPYYVGVVWFGYEIPQTVRYSSYPPPIIWKNIMAEIHEGLEVREFKASRNVVSYKYCKDSGLLASDNCTNIEIGWYKEANTPAYCNAHTPTVPEVSFGDFPFFDPNNFFFNY